MLIRSVLKQLLVGSLFSIFCVDCASASIIFQDDFSGYADNTAWQASSTWGKEASTTLQSSDCYTNKCVRMEYADSWHQLSRTLGNGNPEGYIGFWAKLTNKQASWPKFLKFFGAGYSSTYSNWTLGAAVYNNPYINRIQHGGNSYPAGDSTCVLEWDDGGSNCTGTVNEYIGSAYTWPDANWHKFIIYWKLNTNGNADGAFSVWIDGVLQMRATGVVNRSDNNTRGFSSFTFGDYTGVLNQPTYYIWYDDVVLATTYEEVSGETPAALGGKMSGGGAISGGGYMR